MDLTNLPKEINEWDLHYKKIKQLFITENLSLPKVIAIMKREHKFRATIAQYKKRFKEWGLEKNIPRNKMIKILKRQDERKREGKDSIFVCHGGQQIEEARLNNARLRYKQELQQNAEFQVASPISDVDCCTPVNACSPTFQSTDFSSLRDNSCKHIPAAHITTETHIDSLGGISRVHCSTGPGCGSNTPVYDAPMTDQEELPLRRSPVLEVNSNAILSGIYNHTFSSECTPLPTSIPLSLDLTLPEVIALPIGHCEYTGPWEVAAISPHKYRPRDARSTTTQNLAPPTPTAGQKPTGNPSQRRVVMDLWNQATVLHRENNRDAALELFNRAFDLYTEIINDDDIAQLPTLAHIAWIFGAQGFHKKALELYNRIMAGYENKGGDDNLERLHIIHDVGLLFEKLKHHTTALRLFTRAQAGYKKIVGDNNPYTLNALHNIGHAYYKLDRIDEAISVYEQAFEGRKRVLGEDHIKTKESARRLANAL
ncbi:Clr5 domain-containing protein, partial [Trichophaea hybrida]